jgi:membrane protein
MATVRDVPKVIRSLGFMPFVKKVWAEVGKDDAFTWGSALAYAWIFAIFPFLIFLLTLAPFLPGGAKDKAMKQVEDVAYTSVGGEAGDNIVKSISDVMHNQKGGLLSIGLILALWGASGGMTMTMSALDKAYYVHCTRSFIKQRAIAIGLTVATATLILSVMFLLPVGSAVISYLAKQGHLGIVGTILIDIVRYILALGLLFAIVALIYYFGPCINQKWHSVTPGAVFTVAVWILLGFGFSFYVTHFGNFNKTYGALGAAIILLLFFYINAVVLLIGAEVNSVIDFETLNVKPGATDLTQAKAKAQYDTQHAGEPRAKPEGAKGGEGHAPPIHLPIVPAQPATHRTRNLLLFTSSFLALRFAWRQFWAMRAKRRAKALA